MKSNHCGEQVSHCRSASGAENARRGCLCRRRRLEIAAPAWRGESDSRTEPNRRSVQRCDEQLAMSVEPGSAQLSSVAQTLKAYLYSERARSKFISAARPRNLVCTRPSASAPPYLLPDLGNAP